jgi:RecA-family ATPase
MTPLRAARFQQSESVDCCASLYERLNECWSASASHRHDYTLADAHTLNRSLNGSESNDKDMAHYIRAADAIREAFDCVVIIVHHCGVEGTRPRGHTSLTGAADAQLAVSRNTDENIIVKVEWMKDGAEGDVIASRLEPIEIGTDADGDAISSCVIVPVDWAALATRIVSRRLSDRQRLA